MITHKLRSASHTAEQALLLLNRSQATVADYCDTFGHICRIAELFPTTDPIEFLQQYPESRSTYLSSIYATKSNQLRHERAVKLLMFALHQRFFAPSGSLGIQFGGIGPHAFEYATLRHRTPPE